MWIAVSIKIESKLRNNKYQIPLLLLAHIETSMPLFPNNSTSSNLSEEMSPLTSLISSSVTGLSSARRCRDDTYLQTNALMTDK